VPVAQGVGATSPAQASTSWVIAAQGHPVFLLPTSSLEVCRGINLLGYGVDGVLTTAREGFVYQCYGTSPGDLMTVASRGGVHLRNAADAREELTPAEVEAAGIPAPDLQDGSWLRTPTSSGAGTPSGGPAAPAAPTPADFEASVSTFAFGTGAFAGPGHSLGAQDFVLTNTGGTAEAVGAFPSSTNFSVSHACGTIPPLGSCVVSVQFTPQAPGTFSENTGLPYGAGQTLTLSLSGTAAQGVLVPSQAGVNLSGPFAGANTVVASAPVTLTNTGTGAVAVGTFSTPEGFTATHACGTLAPASSCEVTISYAPAIAGVGPGGTAVLSYGAGRTLELSLTGTATEPLIEATPGSVNFGSPLFSSAGAVIGTQPVTFTNSGTAGVTVGGLAGSPHFSVSHACETLAPGATCLAIVIFAPQAPGSHSAVLSVSYGAGKTLTLPVSGQAAVSSAQLFDGGSAASSYSFGDAVRGASATRVFTLSNTGNVGLVFGATPATTTGAPYTVASTTCASLTLAPGQTCQVSVQFNPTSIGTFNNFALNVNAGAAGSQSLSLHGRGTGSIARWSPSSVAFGTRVAGSTYQLTSTVFNDGNVAGNFNVSPPAGVTATSCSNVAPSGSCVMTFTYSPTAGATYSAGAITPAGATQNSNTLTVSGTGASASLRLQSTTGTVLSTSQVLAPTSAAEEVTFDIVVRNTGTSSTGIGSSGFTQRAGSFNLPEAQREWTEMRPTGGCAVIAPGASCQVTLYRTTKNPASTTRTWSVTSTDGQVLTLNFSGTLLFPSLSVNRASISLNYSVNSADLILTNTGPGHANLAALAYYLTQESYGHSTSVAGQGFATDANREYLRTNQTDFGGNTGCLDTLLLLSGQSCRILIHAESWTDHPINEVFRITPAAGTAFSIPVTYTPTW